MYTKQSIANLVFGKCTGRATAYDLSSTTLNPVKIFNEGYYMLLETAMQKHNWQWTNRNEAINTEDLDELESDQWQYKMLVPEHLDSLKGIFIDETGKRALPCEMHDKYLWINFVDKDNPQGYIRYVSSPCEAIMPSYFVNWFVWFLSQNMCMEISGDIDRLKIIDEMEKRSRRIALAADLREHGAQVIPTESIISARF